MKFEDRYATALRSSNLRSEEKTLHSSADIIGAAGFAGKRHRLAFMLFRLIVGDNQEVEPVIGFVRQALITKAYRSGDEINPQSAHYIADKLLDLCRNPACPNCGGHGFIKKADSPHLDTTKRCSVCVGLGKRSFEDAFPALRLQLAKWGAVELERELQIAAPAAMAALRERIDDSRTHRTG